jgi:hypothetical protein
MDLLLEQATTQTVQGNYELFGPYWGVNTLLISPNEILNAQIVRKVLSASEKGQ